MRRTRVLACALAVAVAAGSCGGSSSDELTNTDAAEPVASAEATSANTAAAQDPASADGEKTLDDYLGTAARLVRSGPAANTADTDQIIEEQRRIEQEVQRCMQAQGFQYTPEDRSGTLRLFQAAGNQSLSPEEYAETEGFGISTRFDAILEGDVDLTVDASPNDEHLAELSSGEADAWQLALSGAPPERNAQGQLVDPETGELIQRGRNRVAGGCRGEAQTAVRGDFSALAELEDDFAELTERIDADQRIVDMRRDWASCMQDRGFSYEDPSEARADMNQQFQPLQRSLFQAGRQADGQDEQGQPGGQQGNRLQQLARIELSPEQDAELRALQDVERAVAVASLECRGDTAEEISTIVAQYEAEFVEANRETLESLSR